jgi:hypothetical protein
MNLGTGICDTILIRISLDAEKDWANGIFMNSRWAIIHIFCQKQREQENDTYTLDFDNKTYMKLRKKKNVPLQKIVDYLIKKINV